MKSKDTGFSEKTLSINGSLFDLSSPKVMGIINLTPDSFYEGSRFEQVDAVVSQVRKMIEEGVDIVDIGAYSTRPGATEISVELEKKRLLSALKIIKKEFDDLIISVDTFRASVAKAAIEEGAHIVNDVSGGNLDAEMFKAVSSMQVPYILMHMRGTPENMKSYATYNHVVKEVYSELAKKINQLRSMGLSDIVIDPGFGFAKSIEHNYEILNNLKYFSTLECPVLAGISRKSMIYKVLNTGPEYALNGTTALNMAALMGGASILRVHDVKEAKECITLFNKLIV